MAVGNKRYFINAGEDVLILRNSIVERYNTPADNDFYRKILSRRPGEAVLDIKQNLLVDKVVNPDKVLPAKLLRNIKLLSSFDERVALMQDYFLMSCRRKQDYYLKFVRDTIDAYSATGWQYDNSALAEKMFTTSKTINRYFINVIGTPPKNYFSILRARTAFDRLRKQ